MLSRREVLRTGVLLSGGLALGVACAPQAAAPSAPAPAAAGAGAASTPTKGGTLRVGLSVDVVTLDPHLSGSKFDRQVYHNLYDPLFILDEKLGIQPNLVESYQNPDPKTLLLKLRSGIKFHDGTDLNAEAVRFNFDRMANDAKSVRKGEVANIASTEVVDPLSIKLNLK